MTLTVTTMKNLKNLARLQEIKSQATKLETPIESVDVPVQLAKVVSEHGDKTVTVIGSVPGASGFSPDGLVQVIYSDLAHENHTLMPGAIINVNHDVSAVVGEIPQSSVDEDSRLLVDMRYFEKYDFMREAMLTGNYDGISIEASITDGAWIDDSTFLATGYILTGIATLFAKPPACGLEECHVLAGAVQSSNITQYREVIKNLSREEFDKLYEKVREEVETRNVKLVDDPEQDLEESNTTEQKTQAEELETPALSEEFQRLKEQLLKELGEETRSGAQPLLFDHLYRPAQITYSYSDASSADIKRRSTDTVE